MEQALIKVTGKVWLFNDPEELGSLPDQSVSFHSSSTPSQNTSVLAVD